MNELEAFMSTKEVAEALGVDVATVTRAVQKLGAVLHPVLKNNQGGYLFTSEQVTQIKQEIQKHHNLASRQIDSVSTELEENQTIIQAMMILKNRSEQFRLRAEKAEAERDLLIHSPLTFTFTQIAKELGMPPKGFGAWLSSQNYIYPQNGSWLPYYGFEKWFINKQWDNANGMTGYNLHITAYGRAELLKKYGKRGVENA